jgi:hypothetical protein
MRGCSRAGGFGYRKVSNREIPFKIPWNGSHPGAFPRTRIVLFLLNSCFKVVYFPSRRTWLEAEESAGDSRFEKIGGGSADVRGEGPCVILLGVFQSIQFGDSRHLNCGWKSAVKSCVEKSGGSRPAHPLKRPADACRRRPPGGRRGSRTVASPGPPAPVCQLPVSS